MTKKNLYLIGAGDFGREMESWLNLFPGFYDEWEIIGYLDQNPLALEDYPSDFKIVGSPDNFEFGPDDYAIMCISGGKSKELIYNHLKNRVKFLSFVAPNTILGKFCKFGKGVVIAPNCVISTNVVLGDFVTINSGSQLGHDVRIGNYSSIMANVDLGGHVEIGDGVFIGSNAAVIPGKKVSSSIKIGAGSIVVRNLSKEGTYFGNPAKLIT